VLVIDDEKPVREAITDMLALDNVATLCAATGAEGLVLFSERQAEIGLVLLDLSMPGLSGRETFDRLVEIDPQACIVLSSGYTQAEATRDFVGRPLAGFLHKPYDLETLRETVRQHLSGEDGSATRLMM
jgi:DNA-binding NtrC family response regulator